MSAHILSKISVDVLVQLAVHGPHAAQGWPAMTEDADRLGTTLWQQNYEAAGWPGEDAPLPEYRFEPLPFGITAAEGLKHCAYYEYQSVVDGRLAPPARGIIRRLELSLTQFVEGWDDAPWGWGAHEVAARMGRGGAPQHPTPATDQAAVDPRVAKAEAAYTRAGIALTRTDMRPPVSGALDPRARTAHWEVRFPGHQPWPVLTVELYRDDEQARAAWRAARAHGSPLVKGLRRGLFYACGGGSGL